MQSQGHVGSDGARCTPTAYQDLGLCVPKEALNVSSYSDATCEGTLLVGNATARGCMEGDDSLPTISVVRPDTCDRNAMPKFYGLNPAAPSAVYRMEGAMCVATELEPDTKYWTRSAERSATTFTQVGIRAVGTGRLRVRSLEDDQGGRIAIDTRAVWDETLQASCAPGSAVVNGRMYCAPTERAQVGYRDAACTELTLSSPCGDLRNGSVVRAAELDFTRPRCDRLLFFRVGAALPKDTPVYAKSVGSCTLSTGVPPHAYASAGEVLPSELAELTRVVGP
jgi:hypothetical protein